MSPAERNEDEVIDLRIDDEVIDSRSDGLPPVAWDDSTDVGATARELPTRTLRLVREDTARLWRRLERVHAGPWTGRSFVAFLARAVADAWAGVCASGDGYRGRHRHQALVCCGHRACLLDGATS